MGNLKHEGKAVDVVAPASTTILKGELYRINKWNGIAMAGVLPTDPSLAFSMEASERIWYIKIPSGVAAARGDVLWWSATETFKAGPSDLVITGTSNAIGPACKVEEAVDANRIAAVRVLNIA